MKASERFFEEVAGLFEDDTVTRETKFVDDLNATSFHYMFMVGTIEEITKKKLSYAEMKACETVGDACELCDRLAE